jgi:hypothetical protein
MTKDSMSGATPHLQRLSSWATQGLWSKGFSHWGRWIIDGSERSIGELNAYVGLGGREKELNAEQEANAEFIVALVNAFRAGTLSEITTKEKPMNVPLQQGAVYMIDGRAHRQCACDNRSSICPRGLTRQIQTAGYNHCFIPTPDVLLVAEGAVSAPLAVPSAIANMDVAHSRRNDDDPDA